MAAHRPFSTLDIAGHQFELAPSRILEVETIQRTYKVTREELFSALMCDFLMKGASMAMGKPLPEDSRSTYDCTLVDTLMTDPSTTTTVMTAMAAIVDPTNRRAFEGLMHTFLHGDGEDAHPSRPERPTRRRSTA